jgi:hypothetical protein
VLTPGLGVDLRFRRLQLFTEARIFTYPRFMSDRKRYREDKATKALFIGVRL